METLKKVSPFRLSSLLRLQTDPNLALQLFQNPNPNATAKPFRRSLLSYDLIITKLGHAKMFDEMEQILHQLKQETRFTTKEIILCNVITYYGRARLADRALQIFEQIPSFRCEQTVKSVNSLLNALVNCRRFDKVEKIVRSFSQYATPDACTYNILIKACSLKSEMESAWNVFDEMRRKGIHPTVETFGTLIKGLCGNGKLDEAFRLKKDMTKTFNVNPNGFVYNSLIKGVCEVGQLNFAFELKEEMLENKLALNSALYTTFFSALFKAGRKEEAFGVLKEMRENGCQPDNVTYNAMISGHCNEKDFEAAYGVLNEMVKEGCKPNVISYNIILLGLCKQGRWKEANDLFEDMPRRGCTPDVVSYRIIFDSLCNEMQLKEAAFILDEMVFKGYTPRSASINNFLEELCKEKKFALLWAVLNSLGQGKIIDVETWRMVVSVACPNDGSLKASELVDNLMIA